jgi:hypothetical protein
MSLFDGPGLDPDIDDLRLGKQIERVYAYMLDTEWHTLAEISRAVEAPEASVSARLRDLRKVRWGGHIIEEVRAKTKGGGLHRYRMWPSTLGLLDGKGRDTGTIWRQHPLYVFCVYHHCFHEPRATNIDRHDAGCYDRDWRPVRVLIEDGRW